jgi:hypothetical protein
LYPTLTLGATQTGKCNCGSTPNEIKLNNTKPNAVSELHLGSNGANLICKNTALIRYIVTVSFNGGGNRIKPGENRRLVASLSQTLLHTVASSRPRHERVRTHKFSAEGHCCALK